MPSRAYFRQLFCPIFILSVITAGELDAAGHPRGEEKLTPKEIASYYYSAVLAAEWYRNTQNTPEHPWGGMKESADLGRFIYSHSPRHDSRRAIPVWGQAVGIMGLLARHTRTEEDVYKEAGYLESAKMAGEYLKTLQILDSRNRRNFGAMRERAPQDQYSITRDAATGGMAFAALYKATGDKEYLYRLRILCDWYIENLMKDESQWPLFKYWFDADKQKKTGNFKRHSDVGAGLMFYYAYKLTGEKRYLDEGLVPLCAPLAKDYHIRPWKSRAFMEMESPWGTNDDFASISLLAAYRVTGDRKYFDAVKRHVDWLVSVQQEDGSYSGSAAAVYVAGVTILEFCQIIEVEGMNIDTVSYYKAVLNGARFGLTQQEKESRDVMAFGGFYGRTNFALNKILIHHRVTGYSLIFNLRHEGKIDVPYYSTYGW
jgi:hypothetical protein